MALITGASRGIGKAVLLRLAHSGFCVIGTATTDKAASEITELLHSQGLVGRGILLDVRKIDTFESSLNEIKEQNGMISVLVNNAAITRDQLLLKMSDEEWYAVMDTNLHPIFHLTKLVIRPMIAQKYGRIINITSVVANMGNIGQTNYSASKSALIGFSKSLAHEVSSKNITVNCVAPGFIYTDMTKSMNQYQIDSLLQTIPAARMGTVDDIASAVDFLAAEQNGYITGHTLHVNGGMYMS